MTCTHAYVGFHTISKIRIRVRIGVPVTWGVLDYPSAKTA